MPSGNWSNRSWDRNDGPMVAVALGRTRERCSMGTGSQWRELPDRYPPFQTCNRRFQQWVRSGRLEQLLRRLARQLHDRGKLDLEEAFVDATFASAKKGALQSAPRAEVRGQRSSLSRLATVFLSPSVCKALLPTKASSSKKSLPEASSKNSPPGSSVIKPTTQTGSTISSKRTTTSI